MKRANSTHLPVYVLTGLHTRALRTRER